MILLLTRRHKTSAVGYGCCCLDFVFFTFKIESRLLSVVGRDRATCNLFISQPEFNSFPDDANVCEIGRDITWHVFIEGLARDAYTNSGSYWLSYLGRSGSTIFIKCVTHHSSTIHCSVALRTRGIFILFKL